MRIAAGRAGREAGPLPGSPGHSARGIECRSWPRIVDLPVSLEPPGSHETPDAAIFLDKLPTIYNGRIARRGESDYYAFDAKAGQTLTFEVISGLPSIGAAGGNAQGFDPSISIYEPSGSWFDPKRVNRIAFNDEPLWVLGQLTDAYLVHKFETGGRRLVRIEAFSGQGGPDYGYELKILPGEAPQDRAPASESWEERTFTRKLSANRLNQLAERGGKAQDEKSIETYASGGLFKLPGTLEGGLAKLGEAQRASSHPGWGRRLPSPSRSRRHPPRRRCSTRLCACSTRPATRWRPTFPSGAGRAMAR